MKKAALILVIIAAGLATWYVLRRKPAAHEELAPETRPTIPAA